MGCDIHLHTEVKINGQWLHYSNPSIDRNYALFAKMADVRNWQTSEIKPISYPKGLPDDCSFLTQLDSDKWDTDGHSHSWLSAAEIKVLFNFIDNREKEFFANGAWRFERQNFGYCFGNSWGHFYEEKEYFGLIEDIRFVFWFDN